MQNNKGEIIVKFTVEKELDGINVQNFLRKYCNVSARLLTKLKRTENGITANKKHIRSIDILHYGDIVELKMPNDENYIKPVNLPLDIVYEDNEIIIVNKPPYMPVHPVRGHQLDTLANGIIYYSNQKGENYTFRVINRLDKNTSGLVLIAKNTYSASFLAKNIDKTYVALCEGELYGQGIINSPIKLKDGHIIQRDVGEGGVPSVTHWKSIYVQNKHTYLELKLETGRTHQIRVHLSSIGHPLAGDDMYGGSLKYFNRQCLHCSKLCFVHPITKENIEIEKLPENWLEKI